MAIRLQIPVVFVFLICALTIVGCAGAPKGSGDLASNLTPVPPVATPTIDIDRARQAFEAGGELSYEEVIALRKEIVGPADYMDIQDFDKFYEEQEKYWKRDADFAARLERCKLKQTTGWVAGWRKDYDKEHKAIPNKNRLSIYVYNPFYGFGKELEDWPEMYLVYMSDSKVATLKYGQRIAFRGDLLIVDGKESVQSWQYVPLEDEPAVPPPTDDEVTDLHITLDRTMCYGTCPDYTLTVEADGTVTFEGRHYTRESTGTAIIDDSKLAELATEIKKAGFFSLEGASSRGMTFDTPRYTLTVQMGGESKEVVTYTGLPRRFDLLMNRIDQIVNADRWIGDETEP